MKKTLFIALALGLAGASYADDVQHEAEGMYYMYSGTAAQTAGATYTLDATAKDSVIFTPEGNSLVTNTLMEVDVKSGATVTAKNSGWNADVRCMDLTIETLKVGDGTGTVNLTTSYSTSFVVTDTIPTQQESQKLTIDQVQGTVSSITNAATMTLGSTGVTTSISGTAVNSGNLTLLGDITFDVSSMTGYTLTDSSAMSAPADNKNGFASGTATYALVSNSGTVDATGATIKTTDGDTITTTDGTMTISKTGTGTKYYIQDGSSVALSTIQGEGSVTDVAVSNGTLELDATGVGLNKITGAGNVTVTTATSLTGSLASAATGTLTVSNATLTVGTSDGQTNSLTSFTAVNLAGGTITYQNKKDTLNNVTVASDSTGVINSIDMGNATGDTLTLAGTTTLAGELTIQNRWNAQFAISKLSGAGTLNIKGTGGATSSDEAATYTLDDTADFTGTINIANSNATVKQLYSTIDSMSKGITYTVTGGSIVKSCAQTVSEGTVDLGSATGDLSGAISGGTINGGTGAVTISGTITGGTINGNDTVTITSTSISNATLNDVKFGGTQRKNISGTVTIGDATNEATGGTYNYALVGSGNLVITGTTDLTKNAAGEDNAYGAIGMGSGSMITVKKDGSLTASRLFNTASSNTDVTVEEGGTLTLNGTANSVIVNMVNNGTADLGSAGTSITSLTNTGSLTIGGATTINTVTLNGGTITLGTAESHDNDLTVSTLKLDATSTINANLVLSDGAKVTLAEGATVTMGCDIKLSGTASITLPTLVTESDGTWTTIATDVEDVLDSNGNSITLDTSSWTKSEGAEKWSTAVSVVDNGDNTYTYTTGATGGSLVLVYDQTAKTLMVTPEPATATLSLLALAGLAARRRRK